MIPLRSGVGPLPFCLLDADEDGRWRAFSITDCVEFCRARVGVGRNPFVGGGDTRPPVFDSAKVPCIGEDAIDGDITFELVTTVLDESIN
jgi:hypothetical protein